MFPVIVLQDGIELPENGTFYVVTSGGIFLHKRTGLVEATVKVDSIPSLKGIKPAAKLRIPKLPAALVVHAIAFFRHVYDQLKSEAVLLLHFSPEHGYRVHAPQQVTALRGLGVSYNATDRFEGFQLIGSMHSHCAASAFHSCIDESDEAHFDGLHITIGRLDEPFFDIACSVAVNNNRFPQQPDDWMEGIEQVQWTPKSRTSFEVQGTKSVMFRHDGALLQLDLSLLKQVERRAEHSSFYKLTNSDGTFPEEWLSSLAVRQENEKPDPRLDDIFGELFPQATQEGA